MLADDKKGMRERLFTELFVSQGAGQHYLSGLTRAKAWNLVSWALIGAGAVGWAVFLIWKPS